MFDVNTKCSWSHTLLAVDIRGNCLACPCMHYTHTGGCVTVKLSQSKQGGTGMTILILTPGVRWTCTVNTTPRLLYPQQWTLVPVE